MQEPVDIYEIGADRTAAFAPPPDSDKAYRVVRVDDLWSPVRQVRHNLPAERDSFVGRALELRDLAARLDAGQRLITVLGPGGTGKTRFVRRYGRAWLGDWPGGVYFCDLSEARSLDGIFFAVASALDVPLGREDAVVQLGHAIAGRGRCLVILDNFEQLVEHAAATVGRWLDRAPDAAFVVTSRERLHVPGEEIVAVEPLPLDNDAIELFASRARAQRPGFVVSDSNRGAIVEAVRLLDGLPLAIELAAARVRILSPAQLVERLRDRFALLAGARGAASRQATMRAAIDWSWELLTTWEQDALAQCAVFEGGFTLEAAEAILDLSRFREAPPVDDVVQALVDKSLLRTWLPHDIARYDIDEPHFGMYLTIHEYASAKLEESGPGERAAAEQRHGKHYARFGMKGAIDALAGPGGPRLQRALALDLDNLVSACRRAVVRADVGVALATCRAAWNVLELKGPFPLGVELTGQVLGIAGIDAASRDAASLIRASAFEKCGRMRDGQELLEPAVAAFRERGDAHTEGLALRQLANVMRQQGKMDEARQALEASLAIHRAEGDRRAESLALRVLGIVHREQGRLSEAEPLYRQALAHHRAAGSRRSEGIVLGNIGNLLAERGDFEAARSSFEAALAIHRELDDRQHEGLVLGNLGVLATETGRHDDARSFGEQALAIHRDVGNRAEEGIVLMNLASLESAVGRPDAARVAGEASLAIAREVGNRRWEGMVLSSLAELSRQQGRHAEARVQLDQALALHRAVGNRRSEGSALGTLGALLAAEGNVAEARAAFASGEALLREGEFRFELIELLCRRGHAELAANDATAARATLAAVREAVAPMGDALGARLSRDIGALEDAVEAKDAT